MFLLVQPLVLLRPNFQWRHRSEFDIQQKNHVNYNCPFTESLSQQGDSLSKCGETTPVPRLLSKTVVEHLIYLFNVPQITSTSCSTNFWFSLTSCLTPILVFPHVFEKGASRILPTDRKSTVYF